MRPWRPPSLRHTPTAIRAHCYCDVSDRNGMARVDNNRTPGGQIVQCFWDYYRYTNDVDYLLTKGWPVIMEVARFYYSLLEKRADGCYHTTPGWAYEGGNMLRDCITELVVIRRVFEIALETAAICAKVGEQKSDVSRQESEPGNLKSQIAPAVSAGGVGVFAGRASSPRATIHHGVTGQSRCYHFRRRLAGKVLKRMLASFSVAASRKATRKSGQIPY